MNRFTMILVLLASTLSGCESRNMEAYCNASGQGTPNECHEWWGGR